MTGESEPAVRVARVYDPPGADDGWRVLVDRLWPRGLRKEGVHLDEWCKDVAPSTELRSWYGHRRNRFEEFARRYECELDDPVRSAALSRLRELAGRQQVTLLTATKDAAISGAWCSQHCSAAGTGDLLLRPLRCGLYGHSGPRAGGQ